MIIMCYTFPPNRYFLVNCWLLLFHTYFQEIIVVSSNNSFAYFSSLPAITVKLEQYPNFIFFHKFSSWIICSKLIFCVYIATLCFLITWACALFCNGPLLCFCLPFSKQLKWKINKKLLCEVFHALKYCFVLL